MVKISGNIFGSKNQSQKPTEEEPVVSDIEQSISSLELSMEGINREQENIRSMIRNIENDVKENKKESTTKDKTIFRNYDGLAKNMIRLEKEFEKLRIQLVRSATKEDTEELGSYIRILMGRKYEKFRKE